MLTNNGQCLPFALAVAITYTNRIESLVCPEFSGFFPSISFIRVVDCNEVKMMKIVLFLGATLFFRVGDAAFKLEERYSWSQLDFVFPSQAMKEVALAAGTYIPTNALPVGIEHWGSKLFVTVPRWRDGKWQPKSKISSESVQSYFRWRQRTTGFSATIRQLTCNVSPIRFFCHVTNWLLQ